MTTRRNLLVGLGLGTLAWASPRSALAGVSLTPSTQGRSGNVLVTIFLRGGADGLSLVVPYREDNYHRKRPNVGLPSPTDRRFAADKRSLNLDGFFGLNPALAPLLPLYRDGNMAVVHACGSNDETRSHFEAMSAMERGLATDGSGPASGWIARHLAATEHPDDTPLRAVAIGSTMPDSLRGATQAVAMNSLKEYRLRTDTKVQEDLMRDLAKLCEMNRDEAGLAGSETLKVLHELNGLNPAEQKARHGAQYPESDLGRGLREVATLIRADVGLEVASLDKGGWDSHVAQGGTVGWLPNLLQDLAASIAAFTTDMGPEMKRVTVVVMSEFGRRLAENNGLGTDHGHGGALFLLGGGVRGGRVVSRWPGLDDDQLTGPGDLQATTDYRDVLGEVLARRHGNARLGEVFVGHRAKFENLIAA
jgi:uncharacterized protein (DUF1501 family)